MAEFPALPLWTDAYLGDTTHLTTFEHGAYLLLLMVSWRSRGCCLPDDDVLLARYAKTTLDKWRKLRPILSPFFSIREDRWHQARLQDEFQHLQSRKSQQIEAGNASAKAKALKRHNRSSTDVAITLQRNANEASTPTPTPISTPIKEQDTTHPVSVSQPTSDAMQCWNRAAVEIGWPSIRGLNETRRRTLASRLRDEGLDGWCAAITKAHASPYLGRDPPSWFTFDWVIKSTNFAKLMEGNYDRRTNGGSGEESVAEALARVRAEIAAEEPEARGDDPSPWVALPSNVQ